MDKQREQFEAWWHKRTASLGKDLHAMEFAYEVWQNAVSSQHSEPTGEVELPPLPAMKLTVADEPGRGHYFSADQMQEYARAAIAAQRAEQVGEVQITPWENRAHLMDGISDRLSTKECLSLAEAEIADLRAALRAYVQRAAVAEKKGICPDQDHLAALALGGHLPEQQAKQILREALAPPVTPKHIEEVKDLLLWPVTEDDARAARDMLQSIHFDLSMQDHEPLYQIKLPNEPQSAWFDASEEAYHLTSERNRRVVYASPSQPQQEAVPAEPSAQDKRDAARYRWLRQVRAIGYDRNVPWCVCLDAGNLIPTERNISGIDLDLRIDAAIAMSAAKEPGNTQGSEA